MKLTATHISVQLCAEIQQQQQRRQEQQQAKATIWVLFLYISQAALAFFIITHSQTIYAVVVVAAI